MPTVLRVGPYRLFFYSGDREEPPHIHVERDSDQAKVWLDPVRLEHNRGFSGAEINRIMRLVEENREVLLTTWKEFFNE
ncbi:MAG: DUF4160 domain-containing protein [Chloroflexi bacterium]|nr:DUF4160 domain-containing protein [Chloroflexota bacterium]MCI0797503.1 DUF4160 domain-containing protein [Chloroflexota bacterium]MCI0824441.1 DUF4160 domain-containing protein [Chloroflexota bacterium]MCI0866608.1 DUF4160 domain-containing protein [Chloroflexota bacterium]MCI0894282.1 DUF4160 domain-containing protein [Chloroflexota bacterium]